MRAGSNPQWLMEGAKLMGITLGSDFCAEHEWGIRDLRKALGTDGTGGSRFERHVVYTKPPGMARRTITKHEDVRLYASKNAGLLLCEKTWVLQRSEEAIKDVGMDKFLKDGLPHGLRGQNSLRAAWDDCSFGIYADGENFPKLQELHQAFLGNQIAIWIGGHLIAFENGGLILGIVDRIPEKFSKVMEKADLDHERLDAASEKTGILERLKAARCGYYACSPHWKKENQESAHPVVYFLNPEAQDRNNVGWFSVEELDQWIAGTGPIPKKEEPAKKG